METRTTSITQPTTRVLGGLYDHPQPDSWGLRTDQGEGEHRMGIGMMRPLRALAVDMTLQSPACWAIVPLQDVLGLGNEARMNRPGTLGGNWSWRQPARHLDSGVASDLRQRVRRAGRLIPQAYRSDSVPTIAGGARAGLNGERVAYFCMEYGLSHDLPIYSGGLGVLAGDIVKAAADQHRDFIAIGILWGEGYFVQDVDANGRQSARYVARHASGCGPPACGLRWKLAARRSV